MTHRSQDPLPVLLRSPVHADVLFFCIRNHGIQVRSEHLARSLGRSFFDVDGALDDLVAAGWISRKSSPAGDVVEFLPPSGTELTDPATWEPYLTLLRSASAVDAPGEVSNQQQS